MGLKLLSDEQRKLLKEKKKKARGDSGTDWYTTDEILKTGALYNIIYGERSNGKSYAIKKLLLTDVIEHMQNPEGENKHRFMYIRRYSEDVSGEAVLQWLSDMCTIQEGRKKSVIDELTDGRYNGFDVSRKKIYCVYRDDDGKIGPDKYLIGYFVNIGDAERIKSQSFLDVYNVLLEEFIATSKPYLSKEPEKLENIISTIARRRFIRVFMVGNNNDRDNLYFRYWGLTNVKKQKEGTIDVYEKVNGYEEDGTPSYIKIAVEFCPDNVHGQPGMFFGRGMRSVSGAYSADPQPCMEQSEIDELDEVYRVYCEYHDLRYICQLLLNKEQTGYFWYVKAYNRTIPDGARVVSGMTSTDPMTTLGFIPLFPAEEKFFRLMEQGKVFFCDDLTGTEFKRACKFFFQNRFYSEDV